MFKIPVSIFYYSLFISTIFSEPLKFVTSEYPPYSSSNIKNNGILVQIIKESYKAVGNEKVKIIFEPWYRALENTKKGKYHGVFTLWYKKSRVLHFAYSDPIINDRLIVFMLKKKNIILNKRQDLYNYKLGTVIGYGYPEWFIQMKLNVEENAYDGPNFQKLLHNRIDIVIAEENVGRYYIKKYDMNGMIQGVNFTLNPVNHYLGFSRLKKNYKKNLYKFNHGLNLIKNNGKYYRIVQNYKIML